MGLNIGAIGTVVTVYVYISGKRQARAREQSEGE